MAAEPRRGPLGSRLDTLEAMVLLIVARALIGCVRFERWRHLLGRPVATVSAGGAEWIDRYYARVLSRALSHLPFKFKCLPAAMALHWMLHRRKRPSQIVLAALPREARVGRDDLHAWTELGGEVLIGQLEANHYPLIRFGYFQPTEAA